MIKENKSIHANAYSIYRMKSTLIFVVLSFKTLFAINRVLYLLRNAASNSRNKHYNNSVVHFLHLHLC